MVEGKKSIVLFDTCVFECCISSFLSLFDYMSWQVVYIGERHDSKVDVTVVLREDDIFTLGYMVGALESDID